MSTRTGSPRRWLLHGRVLEVQIRWWIENCARSTACGRVEGPLLDRCRRRYPCPEYVPGVAPDVVVTEGTLRIVAAGLEPGMASEVWLIARSVMIRKPREWAASISSRNLQVRTRQHDSSR